MESGKEGIVDANVRLVSGSGGINDYVIYDKGGLLSYYADMKYVTYDLGTHELDTNTYFYINHVVTNSIPDKRTYSLTVFIDAV